MQAQPEPVQQTVVETAEKPPVQEAPPEALHLQPTAIVPKTPADNTVRKQLAKRLSDVICIPSSQLTPQERHMAAVSYTHLTLPTILPV